MIQAIIFDMDGTLLDTITDLTLATNKALQENGYPHHFSEESIKLCFGWAMRLDMIKALALAKGLPEKELEKAGHSLSIEDLHITEEEIQSMHDSFTHEYSALDGKYTTPYPGILSLLKKLKEENIKTAIASNKDDKHVKKLAKDLFPHLFPVAQGHRPGLDIKPSPSMIFQIADILQVDRKSILYVGDSEVDILTGQNGGFPTISVTWGFRTKSFLQNHGAIHIADNAEALYQYIHS